jgi:hypothetical protein
MEIKMEHISNEQLLKDIDLTERERDAYLKLCDGFLTLAGLPENIESGESRMCTAQHYKYSGLATMCSTFLDQLLAIKKERGL